VEEIGLKVMAEAEQTKVCPLCAETIKKAAKVCPFCRKNQARGFFISRFDLVGIVTVLLLLGTYWFLSNMLTEGRSFSSSRDKIEVLSTDLTVETNGHGMHVVVTGVLTNRSNYPWRISLFEVRFFDSSGKVIDADRDWNHFTVMPGSDHAFQLAFYSRKIIPEHARYKVLIRSASDPRHTGG
jgi:hypothetical protein